MSKTKEAAQTASSGGIGFCGLLTILFIGLKLTGYIDWSWFWVLSPLFIGPAIILATIIGIALVIGIVILAIAIFQVLADWRADRRAAKRERDRSKN